MPTIGRLQDLHLLSLEESNVTNQGLAKLPTQMPLRFLRLEGKSNEFTAEGLPTVARLRELQHLVIAGRSFSDESLEPLQACPTLQLVTLLDTAVSLEAIRSFRSQHRSVSFWEGLTTARPLR